MAYVVAFAAAFAEACAEVFWARHVDCLRHVEEFAPEHWQLEVLEVS